MKAGDLDLISVMYGHYIRCLPKEVLVRLLEGTPTSIQGVNMAKDARDSPPWAGFCSGDEDKHPLSEDFNPQAWVSRLMAKNREAVW